MRKKHRPAFAHPGSWETKGVQNAQRFFLRMYRWLRDWGRSQETVQGIPKTKTAHKHNQNQVLCGGSNSLAELPKH